MPDRPERGLFDTSVVVDLETLPEARLPVQAAIATVTLAELAGGVHSARDPFERGARLLRLQLVESTFEGLPFDAAAARAPTATSSRSSSRPAGAPGHAGWT